MSTSNITLERDELLLSQTVPVSMNVGHHLSARMRGVRAAIAVGLIGSVLMVNPNTGNFIVGEDMGAAVWLPLLGIYPGFTALLGFGIIAEFFGKTFSSWWQNRSIQFGRSVSKHAHWAGGAR